MEEVNRPKRKRRNKNTTITPAEKLTPQSKLQERHKQAIEDAAEQKRNRIIQYLASKPRIRLKYRNYKSVDWIEKIINGDYKGKCIDSRIKENLIKKCNRHLLNIMSCLITDALKYHEANKLTERIKSGTVGERKQKIKTVTMKAKVKGKLVDKDRVPVLVKADVSSIAKRLKISEPLVWKYLKSMEHEGLTQKTGKENKHQPLGAYRIIGGYISPSDIYISDEEESEPRHISAFPVYFWSYSQPGIKKRLEQFARVK